MNTVGLIEAMDSAVEVPEPMSPTRQITVEIISRLQQLYEVSPPHEWRQQAGIRMIHRLSSV